MLLNKFCTISTELYFYLYKKEVFVYKAYMS